jgi:hypothetical protein
MPHPGGVLVHSPTKQHEPEIGMAQLPLEAISTTKNVADTPTCDMGDTIRGTSYKVLKCCMAISSELMLLPSVFCKKKGNLKNYLLEK